MRRKHHITQQDIKDVLLARGQKVCVGALVAMARSKNILISSNSDRQDLANYVAKLPFDNKDIEYLYDLIEYDQRREKMTCSKLKHNIEEDNIRRAINNFQEKRVACGDVLTVTSQPGAPTLILEYYYDEEDYGKARMLQVVRKKAIIEFNITSSETAIRFPANPQCDSAVEHIVNDISAATEDSFEVQKIDLSHVSSSEVRNNFFIILIKSMDMMAVHDVTGVKISRLGVDDKEAATDDEDESDVPGFIKKVILEGRALLAQDEYNTFIKKGFYISNIKWAAIDKSSAEMVRVDFEAGFTNQTQCKDFKYDVKYIYVTEKDADILAGRKRAPTEVERLKYLNLLEKSSEQSINEVTKHG